MTSKMVLQWKGAAADYMRIHKVFLEKSGQVLKIIGVLRAHLPSAIENIFLKPNPRNDINILSIGSGHGEMDIEILKLINDEIQIKRESEDPSRPIRIFNRVIEPNKFSLDLYKAALDNLPNELHNTQITFDMDQPKTFQDYMMEVKKTVQFDIVHFIHSLYYIDVEKALTHCYDNELGEKGLIICVLAGKGDTMEHIKKNAFNIDHLGGEISEIACKHGWNHELYSQEYSIDVTQVFDERSLEGNLLLDFFTHCMNSRVDHKEITKVILNLIKNMSTFADGKYLAKRVENLHFIFK